jgi:hypothetical protein
MDIRNVTEFRNFVNNNKLRNLHSDIDAVSICVMDFERGCTCWDGGARQKIYNNCVILYERSMGVVLTSFKPHFLAHTIDQAMTFYIDGRVIGSMRR